MKECYQDRIDDYLLNRMIEEERKAFEKDIDNDSELRAQLKFTEIVQKALQRNEMLEKMKEWEDDYVWQDDRIEASSKYRSTGSGYEYCSVPAGISPTPDRKKGWFHTKGRIYWMSGAVAILILGVLLIPSLFFAGGSPDSSPSFVDAGTFRSGNEYSSIKQLIIQKQYEEALIAIIDSSLALKRDLAAPVQDTSRCKEIIKYKKSIIAEKQDDLDWLKIQTLLGLNRKNEALELVINLRQKEGRYQLSADSMYCIIMK